MDFVTWRALLETTVIIVAAMLGVVTSQTNLAHSQTSGAMARDCAVIAAVARAVYNLDAMRDVPLQTTMFDPRAPLQWSLSCDWSRYRMAFPKTFDRNAPRDVGRSVSYFEFGKPVYHGRYAEASTGSELGLLMAAHQTCRLHKVDGGEWVVIGCQPTWIS